MKLTSALYVRQLIAKLHPPLPRTERQSQQLLSVLQTSFKRSLDEVHPPPQSIEPASGPLPPNAPPAPRHTSADAAVVHLQSILSHPLFEQKTVPGDAPISSVDKALRLFDTALTYDKVDHSLVRKCAELYRSGLRASEAATGSIKYGSKVALWFATLTTAKQEALLSDARVLNQVMPVLYADGLEEVAWEWLRTLYEGDLSVNNPHSRYDPRSSSWLAVEDRFVSFMVRESLRRKDLQTAVQEFVQACQYREKSGRIPAPPEHNSAKSRFQPLLTTWNLLCSALIQRRQNHGLSSETYDTVLELGIPCSYSSNPGREFLFLYRPVSPTIENLFLRLSKPKDLETFLTWKSAFSQRFQRVLLVSVIDAAELALNGSNKAASRFFLSLAEKEFTDVFPSSKDISSRIEHVREEVQSFAATGLAVT